MDEDSIVEEIDIEYPQFDLQKNLYEVDYNVNEGTLRPEHVCEFCQLTSGFSFT